MLNMNSEFVTVKIEPTTDSEDSHGNEDKISALGKQIEFIPIKTEISESPPHSPVSLAAEELSTPLNHAAVGSPPSLLVEELSVPVKHEGIPLSHPPEEPLVPVKCEPDEDDSIETTLNPATLVAVTYKIEPTGYDDNGLNQFDDPALILPNTLDIPLDNGGVVLSDIVQDMLSKDIKYYKSELPNTFQVNANRKCPKTAAERMREHRARKKIQKQTDKDVSVSNDHNIEVQTDGDLKNMPELYCDGSKMAPEYRDVKMNEDHSENDVSSSSQLQDSVDPDDGYNNRPVQYRRRAKTPAERMRDYRARKKIRKQTANGVSFENQYPKDSVRVVSDNYLNKWPKTSRERMLEHRARKNFGSHTESYVSIFVQQNDNVGFGADDDFRRVREFDEEPTRARPKTPAERMREYRRRKKELKRNNEQVDPALELNATRNGRYVCPICCKRFSSKSNMQRHQQLHERVKLSCSFCGKQYYKLEQLESHVATHTGERRHTCPDCGKKFKTPSHLKQHRRVHMEKPYECGVCQRRFAILPYLVKHEAKNRCKEPNHAPLVCTECGKLFRSTFLLKSHLRRHSTEKPYSCDLCKMMFKYKSTIVRHLQMHDGIRPYKCKFCPKTFTHAGLIKPHLRTHTGEKPYQCPICFKYFTHKHNMNRHAVRHSKIKNLTCEVCLKRFPKESRLIYHMKTHTNERPFSCGVCTKKFSHKQNIIRHYGRKHPGEVYFSTDTDASVAKSIAMSLKQKQCFGNEVIVP